jgi:signal transduction histidine kinase
MRSILEKLFPSLGKKTAFAFIIVFFVAGGSFVYFAHRTGYTMLEKGAQTQAHGVAEFGKAILEYVMLRGQNGQLQAVLERVVASNQASDILILKQDGTIALGAKSVENYEKLPIDRFTVLPQYPGEKFLFMNEGNSSYEYVITPIVKKHDCYTCHKEPDTTKGYLAVKISMDDVRGIALEHRTVNILMTVITFVGLGGVLFIALLFLVIRPVSKLQKQIMQIEKQLEQFARGEEVKFSELEVPRQQDEIAGVMRSFNSLIRRLNETNAQVHELHQIRLEHADRLASAGEMAAGIAHEIKNPIAGVLGALQVFDSETPHDNDRKEIIAEMISQLERVDHTVNDLLSYARPTLPVFEQADVNELIKKTISLLSQQIKHKQIAITTYSTLGEMKIQADRKQIQQVIWNIMLNAVQAIDYKGTVMIDVMETDIALCITIKDSGKGITSDQLANVFQPFFTSKHKGTGLGMTISKRIIEQHHGSIGIDSQVGKGTTVTISLPIHQHQK